MLRADTVKYAGSSYFVVLYCVITTTGECKFHNIVHTLISYSSTARCVQSAVYVMYSCCLYKCGGDRLRMSVQLSESKEKERVGCQWSGFFLMGLNLG